MKQIYLIFIFGIIFSTHSLFAQINGESQVVEMDARDYVAGLHRDADQVQAWTDEAGENQESAKFSELNRRFSELKGLLSVLDQMLEAGPQNYDEQTFALVNARFNRTFREAEEIEKLDEAIIAQMKKVDDEALLNEGLEDSKGFYTSKSLSYDEFSDFDAARQNIW